MTVHDKITWRSPPLPKSVRRMTLLVKSVFLVVHVFGILPGLVPVPRVLVVLRPWPLTDLSPPTSLLLDSLPLSVSDIPETKNKTRPFKGDCFVCLRGLLPYLHQNPLRVRRLLLTGVEVESPLLYCVNKISISTGD